MPLARQAVRDGADGHETHGVERPAQLRAGHDRAPHERATQVLGREQRDAGADAHHVRAGPAVGRVEGVDETVAPVDTRAEARPLRTQGRQRDLGCKHQRPSHGRGHDAAVECWMCRWAAPGHVATRAVRCAQAPHVLRPARKARGLIEAEAALGVGGGQRVREVVHVRGALLAAPPEVDEGVRVLMDEQGTVTGQVAPAAVLHEVAPEAPPDGWADGMGWRADRQQRQQRVLAVGVPAMSDEAALGAPAVAQQARPAAQHPAEVHRGVERVRPAGDLRVVGKAAACGQHAAQRQRRVDARDLAVPHARTRARIHPVVEEALHPRRTLVQEAQRQAGAGARLVAGQEAALRGHAQTRQVEAAGRDAGHVTVVGIVGRAIGPGPVAHEAGGRLGLLFEVAERTPFQIVEQGLVVGRQCVAGPVRGRGRSRTHAPRMRGAGTQGRPAREPHAPDAHPRPLAHALSVPRPRSRPRGHPRSWCSRARGTGRARPRNAGADRTARVPPDPARSAGCGARPSAGACA